MGEPIFNKLSNLFRGKKRRISAEVIKSEKENVIKELDGVISFLEEVHHDAEQLIVYAEKLEELEKERTVASSGLLQVNLHAQSDILDKLLRDYSAFEDDVVINGIRIKRVTREFVKNAKKAGMKDLVKQKKKKLSWLRNL